MLLLAKDDMSFSEHIRGPQRKIDFNLVAKAWHCDPNAEKFKKKLSAAQSLLAFRHRANLSTVRAYLLSCLLSLLSQFHYFCRL